MGNTYTNNLFINGNNSRNLRTPRSHRTIKAIIVCAGLLTLISCGSAKQIKQEPTLGSLEQRVQQINPQALPSSSTSDARDTYRELARTAGNKDLRARALERLADLQLEQHQTERNKAEEEKLAGKQAKKTQPSKDSLELDDYNKIARQYEALAKRNPGSKDNERILYQLARAYDLSGNSAMTLKTLNRILREFPKTRKKEEVHFRRGEIFFQKQEFSKAQQAYRAILSNKDSNYYDRALYKHGWSLFKQNKLESAIGSFYQLLDFYLGHGQFSSQLSRSEQEIVNDTLRVISLSLSFQKGAATIKSLSRKLGKRDYEDRLYEALGELYIKQDRKDDAAQTYTAYIQQYPNAKKAPGFYLKIIDIYQQGGFTKSIIQAKEDFVERYGFGRVFWSKHNRQLMHELTPQIKSNIQDLAKHYHALGQKSKKKFHFQMAAKYYREYVEAFPQDKDAAQMSFMLAESLNDSGQYVKAAVAYENTAYNYTRYKNRNIAGYTAILVYQKFIATLKGQEKDAFRRAAVISAVRFADSFPKDKRIPSVLLKASEELVDLKKPSEASAIAYRLTQMELPKNSPIVASAWAIIAKVEFDLGRYKTAEMATLKRLKGMKPNDKKRKDYEERLAAAIYKQGEQARKDGDLDQAAHHFLRIGELVPNSKIRINAEYDAATVYVQMEHWDQAIPVLNEFIRTNPKHKFTDGAIQKLAVAYQKSGQWGYAAATFEEIARRSPNDDKKKSGLLWQIAEMYEKANLNHDAIEVYKNIVKTYPKPAEPAVEARLKMADLYKSMKKPEKRRFWLKKIIKADANDGSTERTRFIAAQCALELAEPTFFAFRKVRLVQPLKKSLKKKKKLLQKSIKAYTFAAKYGVEAITTASTYRIAEIYNNFSEGIFKSERPKGLNETEREQYDILLEEQAYPFEEKAIEIHVTNAERAHGGVYDQWVKKSFSALQSLRPARYAKNEKSEQYNGLLN